MRTFLSLIICCTLVGAVAGAVTSTTPATTQSSELPEAATRVTLKLDQTPAVEALRSLFAQADIPADNILTEGFAQQMSDVTVTANLVDQPFMAALLEICRQCWLEPQFSSQPDRPITLAIRRPRVAVPRVAVPRIAVPRIAPTPSRGRAPTSQRAATSRPSTRTGSMSGVVFRTRPRIGPAAIGTTQPSWIDAPYMLSGPFVLVARDARRFSRIDLDADTGPGPSRQLDLTVTILRDPRLRLFAIADTMEVEEAQDQSGARLILDRPPPQEPPRPRALREHERALSPLNVSAALAYPPQTSQKIALLRGHIAATIITRTQPIQILNDSKLVEPGAPHEAGPIRLWVSNLQETGEVSKVDLKLEYGEQGQSAFEEVRSLMHNGAFHASDGAGGAYRVDVSIHSFRDRTYEGAMQFYPIRSSPRPGATRPPRIPKSVIWDAAVEASDVNVAVEFKDLPLP